ncbi:lipoyl synthase [Desulfovibrio litoralis]|uniref:Lipoyl synthase n=1 Tax=Desulfovibrio litoralis DSM 11393 TaxID=1121455 RepID=A0A1M7S160_9BACT|nr:lipoyl synthase [Desulfovibrio litoralis]SHN52218.1 lipoic acid synthetase [Desulfovibrio litoralis DSM 11393]
MNQNTPQKALRIPPWLRIKLPKVGEHKERFVLTKDNVDKLGLHTVCQSAKCPNMCQCFSAGTATFLLLGNICTRNCAFCNIESGKVVSPDQNEPKNIALAAKELGLKHVVLTSVTRDDLPDGGAGQFAQSIYYLREMIDDISIEVLIPDFQGCEHALKMVMDAKPDIINHNVETTPNLYNTIRPEANYKQSLELLRRVKQAGFISKSGFMVGLGETEDEIKTLLSDLAGVECDIVTVGQYMQPTRKHMQVLSYVEPELFDSYAKYGQQLGIPYVFSAPLVRSSFNALDIYKEFKKL